MSETLNITVRDKLGTNNSRRLRRAGQIPAVLYGHGKETLHVTLKKDDIDAVIRHGQRVVDLTGASKESALLRDVQWDAFGQNVLHVDLTRVVAGESVEISVAIELRGEAPGVSQGGIVNHVVHEVTLDCPVTSIPEKIEVNINSLELGDSITASVLKLPPGATLILPGEDIVAEELVVVQCIEPVVTEEDEEAVPADASEPEVIGRKDEEEEGGEE